VAKPFPDDAKFTAGPGRRAPPGNAIQVTIPLLRYRRGEATDMAWIALPLLFVLNAGPSMHWGDVDAGISAPLLWSAGMGIFVVLAGWRAQNRGRFSSAVHGMYLAALVNVPAYVAGHYLVTLLYDCSALDSLLGPAIKQIACGG
jgi:peptidoglycan/LPS O-acetylase OafA/YrhL